MSKDDPIRFALESLLTLVPQGPLGSEAVPLSEARGRVLAIDLQAAMDDPPYSRSIMEGYVLSASDAASASVDRPAVLEVVGEIPVGGADAKQLGPGKAMSVTTGSYIPQGAYSVVKGVEVERNGKEIRLTRPLKPNENIEVQGEFRKKGAPLLSKGKKIGPDEIFLLAGQGILKVDVARRPQVAIFSSGNEVIPPTEPFRTGAIWDCNSYGLFAMVEEAGGRPLLKGIVQDDLDSFVSKVKEALTQADMVVISGGTAIGGRDFTVELVNAIGAPGAVVKGVPMRSGKPIVLGIAGVKPIVCVAGHPPEAARGFSLFGKPAVERLLGIPGETEPKPGAF